MGNTESTLDPRGCCGIQPKNPVKGGGFNAESAAVNGNVANLAVPKVLEDFLEARRSGDISGAVKCCTQDMTMRGPMGEFAGIESVSTKAFSKPSQPLGKMLMLLQYQPHLSSPAEAVFAREFEAQIGYAQVPLRQEVRAPPHSFRRKEGDLCSDALCVVFVCCGHSSPCASPTRPKHASASSSSQSSPTDGTSFCLAARPHEDERSAAAFLRVCSDDVLSVARAYVSRVLTSGRM